MVTVAPQSWLPVIVREEEIATGHILPGRDTVERLQLRHATIDTVTIAHRHRSHHHHHTVGIGIWDAPATMVHGGHDGEPWAVG